MSLVMVIVSLAAHSARPEVGPRAAATDAMQHEQFDPRVAGLQDLMAADASMSGIFDAAQPGSAIVRSLREDAIVIAIPAPGLYRKSEGIRALSTAFTAARAGVGHTPVRFGIAGEPVDGFSYGFMDVVAHGQQPKLGKYLAYWTRHDGSWRISAFKWQPREQGAVSTERQPNWLGSGAADSRIDVSWADRASLEAAERCFSKDAQTLGLGEAFRRNGREDAAIFGSDPDFLRGNEKIGRELAYPPNEASPFRWWPDGVLMSVSGDLGLAFGHLSLNERLPAGRTVRIPFFRIWARGARSDRWRYIAE